MRVRTRAAGVMFHRSGAAECVADAVCVGSAEAAGPGWDLKGGGDLCQTRKSIESHYPEREQVESQGGPCHMYPPHPTPPPSTPAALSGAIAVSHVSAVSG